MTKATWLILLALLSACGSNSVEAPPDEVVPDAPTTDEDAEPALPKIECPENSSYRHGQGAQGVEQYCEQDGVMHGPIRKLYANGNRSAEGSYALGKTDGTWSWWYEDGKKKSKGSYKAGKQTGGWSWWHENGQRAREGDFLNGRKAGQWVSWYDNGHKSEEGLYFNDMKDGRWAYYMDDEDATIARLEFWSNGTLTKETNPGKDKANP